MESSIPAARSEANLHRPAASSNPSIKRCGIRDRPTWAPTRAQAGEVAARLGVGIVADPLAVIAVQFIEVVVPVRPQCQGISDKGAHDGACCGVLNGCV